MRIILLHLLHIVISPLYFIALPQGLWLKKNTVRLPEAKGPRKMSINALQEAEEAAEIKLLIWVSLPQQGSA